MDEADTKAKKIDDADDTPKAQKGESDGNVYQTAFHFVIQKCITEIPIVFWNFKILKAHAFVFVPTILVFVPFLSRSGSKSKHNIL